MPSWPRPSKHTSRTWCSAPSRAPTSTPGCLISRARRSSKGALASSGLPYTITGPRTFSTTRWAGRGPTASRPGYSTCRCRPTGRCSSWPARTGRVRRQGAARPETLPRAAHRAGQRRRHAGADGRGAQRGCGPTCAAQQTPLESIRNPDMYAMWRFLNGPGYRVDIDALRTRTPTSPGRPSPIGRGRALNKAAGEAMTHYCSSVGTPTASTPCGHPAGESSHFSWRP